MKAITHTLMGETYEWERANPVLYKGVLGIEKRTNGSRRIKIGDGRSAWDAIRPLDVWDITGLEEGALDGITESVFQNQLDKEVEARIIGDVKTRVEAKDYIDDKIEEHKICKNAHFRLFNGQTPHRSIHIGNGDTVNLNTLYAAEHREHTGFYIVDADADVENAPETGVSFALMIFSSGGAMPLVRTTQIAFVGDAVYTRSNNAQSSQDPEWNPSEWSPWKMIGEEKDTNAAPDIQYSQTDFKEFIRGFLKPKSGKVYEPVYIRGPTHGKGNTAFYGGVLLPDGRVLLVPRNSPCVGLYDPITNTYTDGPAHGKVGTTASFDSGVLLPDGRVLLMPFGSPNIGLYDPATNTYTDGPTHGKGNQAFKGGVLLPDGRVLLVPYVNPNIGLYDPATNTYTDGPIRWDSLNNLGQYLQESQYGGGVLLPDGRVLLVPHSSKYIGLYDPVTNTYTLGPEKIPDGINSYSLSGGVLLPDGRVFLVPRQDKNIGLYDPVTNTYTVGPAHGRSSNAFNSGVLLPDGRVLLVPSQSTSIGLYDPVTNTLSDFPAPFNNINSIMRGSILLPNGNVVLVPMTNPNIGIVSLNGLDTGIGYCLHPYQ